MYTSGIDQKDTPYVPERSHVPEGREAAVSRIRPNMKKGALIFLGISLFCLVIFIIYDRFSHNVRSPYMTWLFAWPLVLGVLPCTWLTAAGRLPRPTGFTINLYCSGVAALTVSSLLRGIFEIAGTASPFQTGLAIAGMIMTVAGMISYVVTLVLWYRQGK